ncbi:hypothetical protein J2Z83_003524 [Virgibacillus natechei]|uniref:Uncharacterized protein n=1 Tax=Virgibacillus natechei TaxID=1216297 RepID=A0ABS4IKF4_9BACI|nr:hypothetical protein [Virgibacillus natechei]
MKKRNKDEGQFSNMTYKESFVPLENERLFNLSI